MSRDTCHDRTCGDAVPLGQRIDASDDAGSWCAAGCTGAVSEQQYMGMWHKLSAGTTAGANCTWSSAVLDVCESDACGHIDADAADSAECA